MVRFSDPAFMVSISYGFFAGGAGDVPEIEEDIHRLALRDEFPDALRGGGERNPMVSLMLNNIWNQPI